MDLRANPFYEVYVGEKVAGHDFVRIFSEYLVDPVEALFLPGNVILLGVQGSGKSMLLSLLRPEVRIAYYSAREKFPLGPARSRFIGAGINLNLSNASDFAQRPIFENGDWTSPLHFADFVNYWICNDILSSVEKYAASCNGAIAKELGIDVRKDKLDAFAAKLAADDCWFGYLDEVQSYSDLRNAFRNRIKEYRAYLGYNRSSIPDDIRSTKTGIGVPISRLVRTIRDAGVAPNDVEFFVQIDQYEELCRLEASRDDKNWEYRRIINKAIAIRDPAVSFKIGTRNYAWSADLNTYGYPYKLEERRDYVRIDLNSVLKRRENSKSWIFPGFAQDVFRRRLAFAGFKLPENEDLLKVVFGDSLPPEEKAKLYAGESAYMSVQIEDDWPAWWRDYLRQLASENPLSARLAESWALQKAEEEGIRPEWVDEQPWLRKEWWRKERIGQALIQIAGRCRGVQYWCGKDDILQLSGGNILVFLSMCQAIWSAWLRAEKIRADDLNDLRTVDRYQQTYGIAETSTMWVAKIKEEGGRTGDRLSFVRYIGEMFYKKLSTDRRLTYPGHNGFSLLNDDAERAIPIKTFLNELTDYGNLVEDEHTTRNQDRKPRTKWYLNPIYCPHFKIPYQRTKEPFYIGISQVADWLGGAGVILFEDGTAYQAPAPSNRTRKKRDKKSETPLKKDDGNASNSKIQLGFDFSKD